MEMLKIDCSLFIFTCAYMCMQAFVYFQAQKEAQELIVLPAPHLNSLRSAACTQMLPSRMEM